MPEGTNPNPLTNPLIRDHYVALGLGTHYDREQSFISGVKDQPAYLSNDPKLTLNPNLMQTTVGNGITINSFLNAMAQAGVSSTQSQIRNIDKKVDEFDEYADDVRSQLKVAQDSNNQYLTDMLSKKLELTLAKKEKYIADSLAEKNRLEEEIKHGSGLSGMISGGTEDIAKRNLDLPDKIMQQIYAQEPNSNIGDYLKYEAGTDVGSSASMLGIQMTQIVAPWFGKKLLARMVANRALPVPPIYEAAANIGFTLGELAATWKARDMETKAEMGDAWNEAYQTQIGKYMEDNHLTQDDLEQPQHQKALRQMRLKADGGMDRLRAKNMALMYGDMLELGLALTPYDQISKTIGVGNRWARTAMKGAAIATTLNSEMNEEGSQFLFTQQYLDKVLGNKTRFADSENVDWSKETNLPGYSATKQTAEDRWEVEKAMFYKGDRNLYADSEFRSSVNAGAIATGALSFMHPISIVSDFYGFHKAGKLLGNVSSLGNEFDYMQYKYGVYEEILKQGKEDYFVEHVQKMGESGTNGFTPQIAAQEIARFKAAKKEYDKIDDANYLGGVLELFDFRGISKNDRKIAIRNSLMINELESQLFEATAANMAADADEMGRTSSPLSIKNAEDNLADSAREKERKERRRTKLFKELMDPEKVKQSLNEIYDDFEVFTALKQRQIARLLDENKKIASGEFTRERKANEKIWKEGTDAQKNVLAYRQGIGEMTRGIGETAGADKLEDIYSTSLLRQREKTNIAKRMLALGHDILDVVAYVRTADAKLDDEDVTEISNRIEDRRRQELSKVKDIKDSEGDNQEANTIEDLDRLLNYAEGADLEYSTKLRAIKNNIDRLDKVDSDVQSNKDQITAPHVAQSRTRNEVEGEFVHDHYLNEIAKETNQAINDEDYLATANLSYLEKRLKWLEDVLNDHKHLQTTSDKTFKAIREQIASLKQQLTDAQEAVKKRLADKDLAQQKSYTTSTKAVADQIGIQYNPSENIDEVFGTLVGHGLFSDAVLNKIVEELKKLLVKDANGVYYLEHAYALGALESVVNNTSNKQELSNKIGEEMLESYKDIMLMVVEFAQVSNNSNVSSLMSNGINSYLHNPKRFFSKLLTAVYEELAFDGVSIISEYRKSTDLSTLLKNIEKIVQSTGRFENVEPGKQIAFFSDLLTKHEEMLALQGLQDRVNSEFNTITYLQNEIGAFKSFNLIPTKQQIISLRQLVNWFYSDKPSATLVGFAGSGKTQVAIKLLFKVLGITKDNVIALAPTTSANNTLLNAIGETNGIDEPNPLAKFLAMDVAEAAKKDMIVIDEAGLLLGSALIDVEKKIAEINAVKGTQIKILMLGDPSQITQESFAAFVEKTVFHSTVMIDPLTITYRTDDVDIISLQKAFKGKSQIPDSIPMYSMTDRSNNSFGTMGVQTADQLVALMEKSKNNGRTKLLIVNTDQIADVMRKRLASLGITDVRVLNYLEAQSHTVDEAYVMLDPIGDLAPEAGIMNDGKVGSEKYNKAMYVATSRATKFVAVASNQIRFTNDSKNLLPNETRNAPTQAELDAFVKTLEDQLEALKKADFGLKTNPSQAVVQTQATPTNTMEDEADTEITEDADNEVREENKQEINENEIEESPLQESPPIDMQGAVHNVRYPQSAATKRSKDQEPLLKQGDEVLYVRTHYRLPNGTDAIGITIIKVNQDGTLTKVGVIGKDEVNTKDKHELPEFIKERLNDPDWDTRKTYDFSNSSFRVKTSTDTITSVHPDSILGRARVNVIKNKRLNWGPLINFAEFLKTKKNDLFVKYLLKGNSNYKGDSWDLAIYTSKDIKDKGLNPKVVKAGIPYFLQKITHSNGKVESIHVPLSRRRINSTKDANFLAPLQKFLDDVKQLQAILEKVTIGGNPILMGGLEFVEDFDYTTQDGTTYKRTQSEVFTHFLNTGSKVHDDIMAKLSEAKEDTAKVLDLIKAIRNAVYEPVTSTDIELDETVAPTNVSESIAGFLDRYLITGTKGSRKIVEGNKTIGNKKYTEHPDYPGFFLIEKGDGDQVWRKVFEYKNLHVKIDLPKEGGPANYDIHVKSLVDDQGRTYKNFKNGGTLITRGQVTNADINPIDFMIDLIDNNMVLNSRASGPAEKTFNRIAQANSSFFNTKTGERQFIRVNKKKPDSDREYFTGISLLTSLGSKDINDWISTGKRGRLPAYSHKDRTGKITNQTSLPLTTETLDMMIGSQAFDQEGASNVNEGFGLRMPTNIDEIRMPNKDDAERRNTWDALAEEFEIDLESIDPTEIVLDQATPESVQGYSSDEAPAERGGGLEEELSKGLTNFKNAKTKEELQKAVQDWLGIDIYSSQYTTVSVRGALLTPGGFEKGKELFLHEYRDVIAQHDKIITAKYNSSNNAPINFDEQAPAERATRTTEQDDEIVNIDNTEVDKPSDTDTYNEDEEDGYADLAEDVMGSDQLGPAVSKDTIIKAATKIFGKKFASNPENIVFLTKEDMIRRFGGSRWGRYERGIIYLQTNDDGSVYARILRHEAFHRVAKVYLTAEEYSAMLKTARDVMGDKISPDREVEEWLARQYQAFNQDMNFVAKALRKFFTYLRSIISFKYNQMKQLNDFFEAVDQGVFSFDKNASLNIEGEADLSQISEWFGTPGMNYGDAADNYNKAKEAILKAIRVKIWPPITNRDGSFKGVVIKERIEDVTVKGVPKKGKSTELFNVPLTIDEAEEAVRQDFNDQKMQLIREGKEVPAWLSKVLTLDKGLDVFKEVYRSVVITTGGKLTMEEEEELLQDPSLRDEILDVNQLNFASSLLENVKNLLSTLFVTREVPVLNKDGQPMVNKNGVTITKIEVVHHIPRETVFMLAKQMLVGVDFSSEHFLSQLAYNAEEIGGKSNPQANAVFNFIAEMYILAFENDIYEYKDNNGVTQQKFISPKIKMTNNKLLIFNENNEVVYRYSKITMHNGRKQDTGKFIYRAAQQLREHPVMIGKESTADMSDQQLYNLLLVTYRKGHAADFIAGLRSGIGSLITRDPFVGITRLTSDGGEVDEEGPIYDIEHRYIKNRAIGAQESVDDRMREAVIKVVEADISTRKNKAEAVLTIIGSDAKAVNKVQSIFKLLGVRNFSQFFGTELQGEIILGALKDIFQMVNNKNLSTEKDKDELLGNINGYIGSIVDVIAATRNFGGNTSYISGDKQRNYLFVTGSWLTRIHEQLTKIREAQRKGGGAFLLPEFLRKENPAFKYFQYNPFLKSGLGRLIEHDSHQVQIKVDNTTISDTTLATKYKNEQTTGWITRMFSYGFEHMIGKGIDGKYMQFCYTLSNKPKIYGHEIPLMSHTATDYHILEALRQQVARKAWMGSLSSEAVTLNGVKYADGVKIAGDKEQAALRFFPEMSDEEIREKLKTANGQKELLNKVKNQFNNDANDAFFYLISNKAFNKREQNQDIEHNSLGLMTSMMHNLYKRGVINEGAEKTYKEQFFSQLAKRGVEIPEYKQLQMFYTYVGIQEFYKLNYVNGHFINQFYTGDIGQYKHNADLTKRASGPGSPGLLGLSNDVIGMPREIAIMVADDDSHYFNKWNDFAKGLEGIYGIDYKLTDAQMFYLPKWRTQLEAGYSHFYQIGDVIKPVLYFIDKLGISRFSKNAGIELTPALQDMFPELKELAQDMEKNNIMEFHMASAFKVGRPARTLKNGETISQHLETHKDHNGVVVIPTKHYSIQSNPRSTEGDITNFSQLTYFINVNGKNKDVAEAVYEIDGILTNMSFDRFKKRLKYVKNPDGSFTFDEKKVRQIIIESIKDVPGSERFTELLSAKDGNEYIVPLNFPALVGKVHISFMSTASKKSIKAVHGTGSKLVLQTPKGVSVHRIGGQVLTYKQLTEEQKKKVDKFYTLPHSVQRGLRAKFGAYAINNNFDTWEEKKKFIRDYSQLTEAEKDMVDNINDDSTYMVPTKLLMKTDMSSYTGKVAEVIAPAWWLKMKGYEDGEIVYPDFLTKLQYAVRIPTTGIHSAIPFKVVASVNTTSNIIIAPEELVALHGSDFDVDSLFAVRTELLVDIKKKLIPLRDLKDNIVVEAGQRLGWPHGFEINNFEEMNMIQGSTDTKLSFNEFDRQIEVYTNLMKAYEESFNSKETDKQTVREHKQSYKLAYQALEGTLKNKKAYAMLYMLLHDRNIDDMGQPISFDPIKKDFFDIDMELYHPSRPIKVYGKDGSITPEFLALMKEESPDFEIVQKFREWGITADNISKVISINPETNTFKITNKDIKAAIFADNSIGVITKLKLIYGKLDMNELRNPNNLLHQLKTYNDNFAGVALTGAFANFVKALAYVNYVSGGSHMVDKEGKAIKFSLNGGYDSISEREHGNGKEGKKVWEVLDTLINGAIDNVKEQALEIINATNQTGPTIALLVGLGVPLNDITLFMRQPVLVRDLVFLRGKQRENWVKMESKLFTKDELSSPLTTNDLIQALEEATKVDNSYEKLSHKAKLTQVKVFREFNKIQPVVDAMSNAASVANLTKDFEVTFEKGEEMLSKIEDSKNYTGFSKGSFMSLPQFSSAEEAFTTSFDLINQAVDIYNPKLISKLKGLIKSYMKINRFNEAGVDEDVLSSTIRKEFTRYLITGASNSTELDSMWKQPLLITNGDKAFYVTGADAWIQHFGNAINDMVSRPEFANNSFLEKLTAVKSKGLYTIKWNAGTNLNDTSVAERLKHDLSLLPTAFQEQLVKYSAMENGQEYGIRSFSQLLAPEFIAEQAKNYNEVLKSFINDGPLFDKIKEHFIISFALNNPYQVAKHEGKLEKDLPPVKWLSAKNMTTYGITNPHTADFILDYNDVKYIKKDTTEEKTIKYQKPPVLLIIRNNTSGKETLAVKIKDEGKIAQYRTVTKTNKRSRGYDASKSYLTTGYTIEDHFNLPHEVLGVPPSEVSKPELTYKMDFVRPHQLLEKGALVLVHDYTDFYNNNLEYYEVTDVKQGSEEKVTKYGETYTNYKDVVYTLKKQEKSKLNFSEEENDQIQDIIKNNKGC